MRRMVLLLAAAALALAGLIGAPSASGAYFKVESTPAEIYGEGLESMQHVFQTKEGKVECPYTPFSPSGEPIEEEQFSAFQVGLTFEECTFTNETFKDFPAKVAAHQCTSLISMDPEAEVKEEGGENRVSYGSTFDFTEDLETGCAGLEEVITITPSLTFLCSWKIPPQSFASPNIYELSTQPEKDYVHAKIEVKEVDYWLFGKGCTTPGEYENATYEAEEYLYARSPESEEPIGLSLVE